MELHDRLRWFGQIALLVFVLGAAAFLSGITAIRLTIRRGEVQVPSVVGMRAGDAQAMLAARRLGLRIADRVYSDEAPDRVVRQSPPPGTHVKVSQGVHVVLSLGPRKVPIPELEGKSLRAARVELLRAGLQVGEVSSCRLPAGEPETVVEQSPPPGERGAGSARVNLLVALAPGETSYVMPDFVGLSLLEAQQRIAAAGLRLGKINAVPGAGAPPSVVLEQKPAHGARVGAGAAVELEVRE